MNRNYTDLKNAKMQELKVLVLRCADYISAMQILRLAGGRSVGWIHNLLIKQGKICKPEQKKYKLPSKIKKSMAFYNCDFAIWCDEHCLVPDMVSSYLLSNDRINQKDDNITRLHSCLFEDFPTAYCNEFGIEYTSPIIKRQHDKKVTEINIIWSDSDCCYIGNNIDYKISICGKSQDEAFYNLIDIVKLCNKITRLNDYIVNNVDN